MEMKKVTGLSLRELQILVVEKMTCKQLREQLKAFCFKGYSKLKKSDLIQVLIEVAGINQISFLDQIESTPDVEIAGIESIESETVEIEIDCSKSKIVNNGNVEVLSVEEVDLFIHEEADIESEEITEEEFCKRQYDSMSEYDKLLCFSLISYKTSKIERKSYFAKAELSPMEKYIYFKGDCIVNWEQEEGLDFATAEHIADLTYQEALKGEKISYRQMRITAYYSLYYK